MKNLIEDLDSIPAIFTKGVRGIMLLRRNKDGEEGNAQRKAIKRITKSTKEWKAAILELRDMQQSTHQGYRIYSSLNERNMSKAIHEFKRRQLEVDYVSHEFFGDFYCDITNRFFSCLMNPGARASNYFLIDCDTKEEYDHAKLQLKDSDLIIMEYPTKNGTHIITHPFNRDEYVQMQIKKDDLMFIV